MKSWFSEGRRFQKGMLAAAGAIVLLCSNPAKAGTSALSNSGVSATVIQDLSVRIYAAISNGGTADAVAGLQRHNLFLVHLGRNPGKLRTDPVGTIIAVLADPATFAPGQVVQPDTGVGGKHDCVENCQMNILAVGARGCIESVCGGNPSPACLLTVTGQPLFIACYNSLLVQMIACIQTC